MQTVYNHASNLASIGGNNCLPFVTFGQRWLYLTSGNSDNFIVIEGIHKPINRITGLSESRSARNTVGPYAEYPIYVRLSGVGANLPSGPVVANHLQQHL